MHSRKRSWRHLTISWRQQKRKKSSETKTATETKAAATAKAETKAQTSSGAKTETKAAASTEVKAAAVSQTKAASSAYDNIAVSKVSGSVNIRTEANTSSSITGKIYNDCAATILDTVDGEGGNVQDPVRLCNRLY